MMNAGQRWVRQNPMFISGLTVVMGAPPASAVTEYFTDFHATGVHLWESGLPTELAGWLAARPAPWVSWVNLDGNSTANGQAMGGLTTVPAGRIGYQIGDEPLDMAALLRMQAGARIIRQRDAQGLTILNLTAGGAKGSLGTQGAAMTEFDVLSVDHYTYGWNAYETLGALRSIAQTNGKPYWRYLDSFTFVGRTDSTTESDLRWDALVGIAYGYTGHSWFLYQIEPGNPELVPSLFSTKGVFGSARAPAFQWAANLNLQLASLGRTLTQLRSTDVRYVASVLQPPGTRALTRGAGGDPYLVSARPPSGTLADVLLGFFADDCGETYLFVQSQRHQGADFPNSSQSPLTVTLTFDFTQATDPSLDRTAVLVLDPQTDTLAPRSLSGSTLDVTLPAGGGLLLKYKTARPFVRR